MGGIQAETGIEVGWGNSGKEDQWVSGLRLDRHSHDGEVVCNGEAPRPEAKCMDLLLIAVCTHPRVGKGWRKL